MSKNILGLFLYSIFVITSFHVWVIESINPPTWTSNWASIEAYSNPEVTIDHNLGELPIKVDVEVRITDTSQRKYVIFSAIGSGHRGDDDRSEFGGVIYVYDTNQVKILAPGPCGSCSGGSNGKLVHLGGAKYTGPPITGDFSTGHVRVRLWKQCDFAKPGFVSAPIHLDNTASGSYREVTHTLDRAPDHVIVQVHLDGTDWVMDAQGIAFYSKQVNSFGGVVFASSKYKIRLWTPKNGSGSGSNGVVFNAMDGWGTGGAFMHTKRAKAVVWTWDFRTLVNDPFKSRTYLSNIPANGLSTLSEPVKDDGYLTVQVQVEFGNNDGYTFKAAGTAPTTDSLGNDIYFAGVTYGVMENTIMLWSPMGTEANGCLAMVDGMWGSGHSAQCVKKGDAQLVIILAYTNVDEPPCKALECHPSDVGPTCVCNGTGFEGQYCESRDVMTGATCGAGDAHSSGTPDLAFGFCEAVQCTRPTSQQNAKYSPWASSYVFDTTISFACRRGYEKVSGDGFATCNAYMEWTGNPLICTAKSCGDPDPGQDSTMTVDGITFMEKVTYVCNSGYDIKAGDLERTCLVDQTWSGVPPTCERSCGEPDTNGTTAQRTNAGLTLGVTALYECIVGHEPDVGNFSRTCMVDGTWSGAPPVCGRVTCGAPENATNSVLSYTSQEYQSMATYTCDLGYYSKGSRFFQTMCMASRDWSPMKSCKKVLCPPAPTGVNADKVSQDGVEYGDRLVFTCQHGTMLVSGTLQSTCQANASWSGSKPECQGAIMTGATCGAGDAHSSGTPDLAFGFCEDIVCPHPGEVANGTTTVISTAYDGSAVVICDSCCAIEFGDPIRTCGDGGQWSGEKPHCGGVFMVFLNPVNGTPPCLPFLLGNIGGSPGNNLPLTSDIIRIPLKSTNKYWRTLTSAKDDRWTAKAIGISWVILALSPLIFAMTVDVLNYAIQKSTPPSSGSGGGNTTGSSGVAENTSSQNNPPETSENRDKSVAIVHDMDNA